MKRSTTVLAGALLAAAVLAGCGDDSKSGSSSGDYCAYQAEVIDKVGALVGGMTYGAKKDSALEHFQRSLKIHPDAAIARIEYANGLIMLFGKSRMAEAEKLYQEAAACKPVDAMEWLDVEHAKAELA